MFKFWLIALSLCIFECRSEPRHGDNFVKGFNSGTIEEDILLSSNTTLESKGAVVPYRSQRWESAAMIYIVDSSLASRLRLIHEAMKEIQDNTCVRFLTRSYQQDYVKIFAGQGCYSYVGNVHRGEQGLSLGQRCINHRTVLQQLLQALGLYYEVNRSDRDTYLNIYWDNIPEEYKDQFGLFKPNENNLLVPFDHDSVMMWNNYTYSKEPGKLPTVVAKNGAQIGVRPNLSAGDIKTLNKMYNCK